MFRRIKLISATGQEIEIGEDLDAYVLDQDGLNLGTVGATHNMTQFIDLIGKHLDSTILNPRDIAVTGWIIGESESVIMERKILLNSLVNPMYQVTLQINNYALDFRPDASIEYSTNYLENNEYMCRFLIQGTAPMPLYRLKNYNIYHQTVEYKSNFHFPFAIPKKKGIIFGYLPLESLANMPNQGDVESGLTIIYTAKGGYVVNPKLVNNTTDQIVEVTYTLTDGSTMEICTEMGNQYITIKSHGNTYNGLRYLTKESDIDMVLYPGINKLDLYATEGMEYLQASTQFTPRFLEVEGR